MASSVAPPKSTGAGGAVFEDKVCAWFLLHMVLQEPSLGSDLGAPDRIHLQVRPDGWYLDDLLLTLRRDQDVYRCAFSVKSNAQFTAAGAPADFVRAAWEQYLGHDSTIFNANSDFMGLITAPLAHGVRVQLDSLLNKAARGDPGLLPSRYAEPG